jgi:GT2 family glycosyltransferase
MADVSVIIVNWNTRVLLKECLTSVYTDPPAFALEVIVIDNGSEDGSVEMVRVDFPQVMLIINSTNEGFARPNNVGMNTSTGRCVLLLNSDTVVHPGAIAELKVFLDTHADVGACGPMLLNPDGTVQHSVKGFPSIWTHACDMLFLDRLFPHSRLFGRGEMAYFPYEQTQEVDHLMAAAFLVRREVIDQVGLLDERFSIYYNDMDWCYRMRGHGWKIYYVHSARVTHYLGQTIAQVNKEFRYFRELHENVMLFYQKHYGRWAVTFYKLLLAIGFSFRTVVWYAVRCVKPTEKSRHMAMFSGKTLQIGLGFWKPLKITANQGGGLHE